MAAHIGTELTEQTPLVAKVSTSPILASHLLTRLGDKAWEFAIPVAMSYMTQSLLAPSIFGLVVLGVKVFFGPLIGRWVDTCNRLSIIRFGVGLQALSILGSGASLWWLLEIADSAPTDFWHTDNASIWFVVVLVSSGIGSLSALAMDLAVERDWIPTLVSDENRLTSLNSAMRQLDLATEVAGPLIGGFALSFGNRQGFAVVAIMNFVSFPPQYLLLKKVYDSNSATLSTRAKTLDDSTQQDEPQTACSIICHPWTAFFESWRLFIAQPIVLVTLSFAMLWLTILSPHDTVFTSYLMLAKYSPHELGIFRAMGAAVGIIGAYGFPYFARKVGLQASMMGLIWLEGIALTAGVACWYLFSHEHNASPYLRLAFLGFIIISRPGLYGFEVGEIQLMQQGIPEGVRGRVGSVESVLTSLASLVLFIPPILNPNPKKFIYLIYSSVGCVLFGALLFTVWSCRWSVQASSHSHAHGDAHSDHVALHSSQQTASLSDSDFVHSHLHFHKRGTVYVDDVDVHQV